MATLMFMHATASAAGANDKSARARGDAAIDKHYLAMNMDLAESELTAAIQSCGGSRCSPAVESSLRRDLAMVYLAGKKKGPAKQQMQQAIKLDPALKLNPDLATEELRKLYVQSGGGKAPAKAPEKTKPKAAALSPAAAAHAPPVEEVVLEEEEEPTESEDESEDREGPPKHWASGAFQLDTMLHRQTEEACTAAGAYFCYNEKDEHYGFRQEPALSSDQGNKVDGGIALATIRLLVGYDYHLLPTLTVGGRLGVAFNGGPVDDAGDKKGFLPVHLEVRAQRLFSKHPFRKEAFTPYVGVATGIAQVDSGVGIDVYQVDDPTRYELTGYKKAGRGFVGLSGGTYYMFDDHVAPFAELVFMQMLPVSAQVFALRIGAAYGFDL